MIDYAAKAKRYAESVAKGRIPVCQLVRQACTRHLADLKKVRRRTYPYRLDKERGNRICRFIETLPHVKGRWAMAGDSIKLEPWQCFVLCAVFGWIRKADKRRRFRVVYIEVPRKNAKSTTSAGVGVYMLGADGEYGAEVYSGATSEKQAWEVFRPAKKMVERRPDLREHLGVTVNAKSLAVLGNGSRFEPVIGDPGDGSAPSCAIIDEYHEHKNDKLYDTMLTGMGSREQPLQWVITTAGDDTAGPCYALHDQVVKMLSGAVPNEELFGVIYGIDEDDDWTDPKILTKANPNINISVDREFLESRQREAIDHPRKQSTFKTKHLNVWVTARSPYFNHELWSRLGDSSLDPVDFIGEPCFYALDLSSKLDITSGVRVFPREESGDTHYYVFSRHWLPEERINDPERKHYRGWYDAGHLTGTDGDYIDYESIRTAVQEDDADNSITELAYDPWGAAQLSQELYQEGVTIVEVPQRVQYLSEPMKMIEALIIAGRIHHDGNPVLSWMISNVVAKVDPNDNVFPRKEHVEKKIDGAVALIMAMGRALAAEPAGSVYDERDLVVL